ncbi:putative transporter (YecA family protein with SEC-C motif) [Bradyrhizobium sp. ORS 375]|uniref:UPF0149 family protein n=1 Tax=Bradyrhizobium sp. (strain ORS 375) TaxID=566679 RepID=UPI0002405D98|nr:UPF0149 family protein [Bradyrhizobium sp. ORS 375]CCD92980.1 putative transporter (YecA family protein with SEC-C motif) [Bradyrhizobium sp. ORS 375]
MTEQTNSHDALEQALLALDDRAMVLEELDGFIAGLLILPEQVPLSEWFSTAFGLGKGEGSVFTSIDHANAVLDLVTRYHDDLVRTLADTPKQYQPRFAVDDASGQVNWEIWVEGFAEAAHLRRDRFKAYLLVPGEVARAATLMMAVMDLARHGNLGTVEPIDLGDDVASDIRTAVLTLHRYRHSGAPVPGAPLFTELANPFAALGKTGRNDPCPCGSGRKYKRCCGAN